MKRTILAISSILLFGGILMMSGCKKDDTTPPVITVTGDNPNRVVLNGTYTDPGATATDDEDGDISTSITTNISTTNPNMNLTGTYTITYTVSDAAGNQTTANRTVEVYNEAEVFAGTYTVADTVYKSSYIENITASTTLNKRIQFTNFAGYDGATAYAEVSGTTVGATITVPSQAFVGIGNPQADRTFAGTGAVTTTSEFYINYTETTNGQVANCKGTYTKQ